MNYPNLEHLMPKATTEPIIPPGAIALPEGPLVFVQHIKTLWLDSDDERVIVVDCGDTSHHTQLPLDKLLPLISQAMTTLRDFNNSLE